MPFSSRILLFGVLIGGVAVVDAWAASSAPQQIEVSADNSLEWYEKQNLYVARGKAKAVRGNLTVTSDLLTAHKREAGKNVKGKDSNENGDIDRLTAEGNVVIYKETARIYGDKAVHDVDGHVMVVTGNNLRYETDKQVVTARDSLEYWDQKKIAVARGNASAVKDSHKLTGDVLTAEFQPGPGGKDELTKMTAVGNVTVFTKNDVTRGDEGVYDAAKNMAVITGNVQITRADGTQLSGDKAEADFGSNQSRLLNDGSGRVRALLPARTTSEDSP